MLVFYSLTVWNALLWRLPFAQRATGDSADETCDAAAGREIVVTSLVERIKVTLLGALVADSCSLRSNGIHDPGAILASFGSAESNELLTQVKTNPEGLCQSFFGMDKEQSEHGHELRNALRLVSSRGFEFGAFADAWQSWAEAFNGTQGPGIREALENLVSGVNAEASGSHYIDLEGAVRVPALLLLAEEVKEEDLALASREMQLVSHENPKALQAGEFLLRAALHLLLNPQQLCSAAERRKALVAALHAAASKSGQQFHGVIDEALSEAQSRDALIAAAGDKAKEVIARLHSDVAVIGRMTASGETPGQEVQGGKTSYIVPAIIWFAVGYKTFQEAVLANTIFGGESAVRAIFVGLLLAARDSAGSIPKSWQGGLGEQVPLKNNLRAFMPPLRLCKVPGICQRNLERQMRGVTTSATIVRLELEPVPKYRMYVRLDATDWVKSLSRAKKPSDWNEDEDGAWEMPEARLACQARYFQFTTQSGRHAPFGLWPRNAMCVLTLESPVAYDSFDIVIPEPITYVIGGVILSGRDAKLPRVVVDTQTKTPDWSDHCNHVGLVKLPDGDWDVSH